MDNKGLDQETIKAINEAIEVVTKYADQLDERAAELGNLQHVAVQQLTRRMRLLVHVSRSMAELSQATDQIVRIGDFTPEQIAELKR